MRPAPSTPRSPRYLDDASDHLNLTGATPLEGAAFVDMSAAYDAEWCALFRHGAKALGMPLHEGAYAGLRGPQYETPAEVRMLRGLGRMPSA